jgi:hypothetical protein
MWDRLNPQQGVYSFTDIDLFLDNMKTQKKFAGLRVRTVVDETTLPSAPTWAKTLGVTQSSGQEPFGGRTGIEIDYEKCTFLDLWSNFVTQMIARYDNNPQVSFIDVGTYGWYGEWWSGKTVPTRNLSYQVKDATDPTQLQSYDTRTRIIRMFTGGTGTGRCVDNNGVERLVSYAYTGFKNKPVLVSRGDEEDVIIGAANGSGIRYDAVGAPSNDFRAKVGSTIASTWQKKPIMGEFVNTTPDAAYLTRSQCFAREYHLSGIHNNFASKPTTDFSPLFRELGYRISLQSATYPTAVNPSSQTQFTLTWINKGTAPSYSKYPLVLYFKPAGTDTVTAQVSLSGTDITKMLPADVTAAATDYTSCTKAAPTPYTVTENVIIPALPVGNYDMYFGFSEPVYQNAIQLALVNKDSAGRYLLGQISVQTAATATSQPTFQPPTNTPAPVVVQPTFQPPTNTPAPVVQPTTAPVLATSTPMPTASGTTTIATKTIESTNVIVQRSGTWSTKTATGPSHGDYLMSSGSTSDKLTLTFTGTYLDVLYVKLSNLGSFSIKIDGVTVQTINAYSATPVYGRAASFRNLTNTTHKVEIVPVTGKIAIDAFKVQQ